MFIIGLYFDLEGVGEAYVLLSENYSPNQGISA